MSDTTDCVRVAGDDLPHAPATMYVSDGPTTRFCVACGEPWPCAESQKAAPKELTVDGVRYEKRVRIIPHVRAKAERVMWWHTTEPVVIQEVDGLLNKALDALHAALSREAALAEENGRLKAANIHSVDWVDQTKHELDTLRATNAALQQENAEIREEIADAQRQSGYLAGELVKAQHQLAAAETALGNVGKLERWLMEDWAIHEITTGHDGALLAMCDDHLEPVATAETLAGLGEKLP